MISAKRSKPEIRENLIINIADYMINENATIRDAGKTFGVAKSTVYIYMTKDLFEIDRQRFHGVKKVLEHNKAERHLRGGEATRQKFKRRLELAI